MRFNKIFKLFICLFVFMFVSGCVKDSQRVSAIAPSIETLENYEITNYLGKEVNYKLTDKETDYVNKELPYFYQGQYFTADTTRTPLVELSCSSENIKIKFIYKLKNRRNASGYVLQTKLQQHNTCFAVAFITQIADLFKLRIRFFELLFCTLCINKQRV